jgi:ubiquinone/menaquinone biosynthesis C-methylase UbiE
MGATRVRVGPGGRPSLASDYSRPAVAHEWDRFFDELYLETYVPRIAALDSEAEARAAIELAGCGPEADVLDCPCGYGRHSIPLAETGHRVVGADRSSRQLEEARRRAGPGPWPRFVQTDYRELPFEEASFDAALNLFTGIGYYGDEEDRRAFAEYRRVLRPGGAFVLEAMHRDRLMSIFREQDWEELPDGAVVFERRRFDPVAGEVETSHRLIRSNGERASFDFRIRTYTATELAAMLSYAGFSEIEFLGGLLEREPLSPQHRLVAVARAPA